MATEGGPTGYDGRPACYPNREVRQSLNLVLLRHLVQDTQRQTANSIRLSRKTRTVTAFETTDA